MWYKLLVERTEHVYVYVEADDEDEAMDKFEDARWEDKPMDRLNDALDLADSTLDCGLPCWADREPCKGDVVIR